PLPRPLWSPLAPYTTLFRSLVGDRGVHQAVLLVGVTLMGADGGAVSQLLGLRGGEIALGLPVRVGRIVDDDGDQTTLAPAGLALGIGVVIGDARAGGQTGRGGADPDGGAERPALHHGFLAVRARYSDLGRVGAGERLSARGYTVRR